MVLDTAQHLVPRGGQWNALCGLLARCSLREGSGEGRVRSRHHWTWGGWADGTLVEVDGDESVGDILLVAVGRRPNVEDLGQMDPGVAFDEGGIDVDGTLRTSQPHVFAAGDCLGTHQLTDYVGWQAAIAVRNALLPCSLKKGGRSHVPWTTLTDPEIAHAGLTVAQAGR